MADRSSRPHHSPTKTLPALPAGSLIHVDVTKFGNIPDGGGHRYVGRQQGERNKRATPGLPHGADYRPRTGTAFVHTVIDDHSRVAYAEIHTDVTAAATAVLRRAVAWLTGHGVTVERVLSDNGSACRSHAWRDTCTELGNPALPAPDQWQDRTLPPHPRRRLGAEQRHRAGCTSTIVADPTARPAASRRSPG